MTAEPPETGAGQPPTAAVRPEQSGETAPRQRFATARWAVCFLTRLPLPPPRDLAALGRSPIWFPLVGLALGLLGWAAYLGLGLLWPEPAARGLVLLGALLVADAFHLDGLADCADGLYGGRTPADRLRIMRDPCVGAMGAIAITAGLGLLALGLLTTPTVLLPAALVGAPVVGRTAIVNALRLPYARQEGLGAIFQEHRRRRDAPLASGICLLLLATAGLAPLTAGGGALLIGLLLQG